MSRCAVQKRGIMPKTETLRRADAICGKMPDGEMKTVLYFQSSCCENNDALLRGVVRYAHRAKWSVQVVPYAKAAASRQVDGRGGGDRPQVADLVAFWRPAGAIVDCGSAIGMLTNTDFAPLPAVFLDCSHDAGAPAVRSDGRAVAECAARELLSLGLESFAFAPWFARVAWSRERLEAFGELVRAEGRACHVLDWGDDLSEASVRRRLADWLGSLPRPVGVFAANDYVASLVVAGARAMKMRVPDDVAVVGVDNDLRVCEQSRPTITSVAPSYEGAGAQAAELLERLMRSPRRPPADVLFGVDRIVRRESTLAVRRRDQRVEQAVALVRGEAHAGLTPSDVARQLGCSRRLLEIRFRDTTGQTLLAAIRSARIERARRLLERDGMPLADVARLCGYGSECAFRRAFAQETHSTPRQFQRGGAGRTARGATEDALTFDGASCQQSRRRAQGGM